MALDLAVLVVLAAFAVHGAFSGALRQLVHLAAVILGWLAARELGPAVAEGLGRAASPFVGRLAAPLILFFGVNAAVSLAGGLALRATGLSRAVDAPADRAVGALLGGVKAAVGAWVVLSAVALAGEHVKRLEPTGSDLAALAREHNLLERLDPGAVEKLDRLHPRRER